MRCYDRAMGGALNIPPRLSPLRLMSRTRFEIIKKSFSFMILRKRKLFCPRINKSFDETSPQSLNMWKETRKHSKSVWETFPPLPTWRQLCNFSLQSSRNEKKTWNHYNTLLCFLPFLSRKKVRGVRRLNGLRHGINVHTTSFSAREGRKKGIKLNLISALRAESFSHLKLLLAQRASARAFCFFLISRERAANLVLSESFIAP